MKVKIKKLDPKAVIPAYAKSGDAGLDLTAISAHYDHETNCRVYRTGLAIEIPQGHVGLLFPRSSLCKYDQILTNHVGVIDSGYRGEICFKFKDTAPLISIAQGTVARDLHKTKVYHEGERVGQILIIPYPSIEFEEVTELSETERGTGGYGSSGK